MQTAIKVWRKQKKDKLILNKEGIIVSWTRVSIAPPDFESFVPYVVVLVELDSKTRVYGQLVDFEEEDLKIGRQVYSVYRISKNVGQEDVIEYGVKFKPL